MSTRPSETRAIRNVGPVLKDIDGAFPAFIEFLVAECHFSFHGLTGHGRAPWETWRATIAESGTCPVKAGRFVDLCLKLNSLPHQLPCLSERNAQAVLVQLHQKFPDWQPEGEPRFDDKRFYDWLADAGLQFDSVKDRIPVAEIPDPLDDRNAEPSSLHMRCLPSQEPVVATFLRSQRLIQRATEIDLYLYTGETTINRWRQEFFRRIRAATDSRLSIRLLIRHPSADEAKRKDIEGTLDSVKKLVEMAERQGGTTIQSEVRHYDEDPTFRLYFFKMPEGESICLAGFYHYDRNNPVRFVGAEDSQLIVLSSENAREKYFIDLLRSRFHFAWEAATMKAVIFDMDGVLVDGMPNHHAAWRQAFLRAGVELDEEEVRTDVYQREGENVEVTAAELYQKYTGTDADEATLKQILQTRKETHRELSGTVTVMEGIHELLDFLKERKLPLAVVTGSTRDAAEIVIRRNFPDQFDELISGDDFDKEFGKPHPLPYLTAAKKLNIEPERCLVIENAPLGVKSGSTAGMTVYGVLINSPLSEHNLIEMGAERVVSSHAELRDALRYP